MGGLPPISPCSTPGSLLPPSPLPGRKTPAKAWWGHHPLLFPWKISRLFGLWSTSACREATARSSQINLCRFLSIILVTTLFQKLEGNPRPVQGDADKLQEEAGRCQKPCSMFILLHLASFKLSVCPPLQKPGAEAWLLPAL